MFGGKKVKEPLTKIKMVKGKFEGDESVEDSITHQVIAVLENFNAEFQRQGIYGENRSIRGVAMIDFKGGKFVLDMRLLPDDEVETDELFKIVQQHVEQCLEAGV
jgi:hypothetical protein